MDYLPAEECAACIFSSAAPTLNLPGFCRSGIKQHVLPESDLYTHLLRQLVFPFSYICNFDELLRAEWVVELQRVLVVQLFTATSKLRYEI